MKLKKLMFGVLSGAAALALLSSCAGSNDTTPVESQQYYDVTPTSADHYFSNKVTLTTTGATVKKNAEGKLEGKFIEDGIAKLKLKSITDGDTAVFYLNGENDTYTVDGKQYSYVTIRYLGIDTPESTSSIDPWGKKASNYGKELLKNAEGIIVDALDKKEAGESSRKYANRLDSNGTRWLGLIWYCPKGGDPEDLSQYRSYQLDIIEECYSEGVVFDSKRVGYIADKTTEPILYNRYKSVKNLITGEDEARYGTIMLGEAMYEAGQRMKSTGLKVHGELDDGYDYSKKPTSMSISEAYKQIDTLISRGTYVELKGVITRFISTNFYFEDEKGKALYVYMGIDGNAIDKMFKVGDTIKIRGRLCEYGGQYQMSGIEFKQSTFTKVTGDGAIPMPEAVDISDMTFTQMKQYMGRLVTTTITNVSVGSQSKDGSYSLTSSTKMKDFEYAYKNNTTGEITLSSTAVSGATQIAVTYSADCLQARVNGSLTATYPFAEIKAADKATYKVTGILSIYQDTDYTLDYTYGSYQIALGNVYGTDSKELIKQ